MKTKTEWNQRRETGVGEECGVFGIYDIDGKDVASSIYYGLCALQHRGQESCGIVVSDTRGERGNIAYHKDQGLVSEVFKADMLASLHGNLGIGHVRYSTTGGSTRENAQPLVLNYIKGTLALAHNGNLINAPELKEELVYGGAIFHTTTDSEMIAYCIAKERVHTRNVEEAILCTSRKIRGGYALVVMSPRKLVALRDPFGLKPLCIGKRGHAYVVASESCALDAVGAEFIRDIEPGEMIAITKDGIISNKELQQEKRAHCIFEYIYFARPDSEIDGVGVYHSRIQAGRYLAQDSPVEADIVVGVPESGNAAALGYSLESGIPYGTAFVKNGYVGRTFIKPGQSSRESSVQIKLNVLKEAVKGKRVIMIDDSIVRGTTSDRIVKMLRDAGATEVHVRISSPPFLWPCYFGTDIPEREQLIAYNRSINEICEVIGADSLGYLGEERLSQMVQGLPICKGCFTGEYPMKPPTRDIRGNFER